MLHGGLRAVAKAPAPVTDEPAIERRHRDPRPPASDRDCPHASPDDIVPTRDDFGFHTLPERH
jgi:hypothetical protein